MLLFKVPVTSNTSRHFKSPLAMGEMPFKIKRASSVPISVVIDTGVNSNQVMAVEKYQKIDYNFHKILIPGSKGQKADASLLARGFLTS